MSTELKRVLDFTDSLTEENLIEAIRKAKFGEKLRETTLPILGITSSNQEKKNALQTIHTTLLLQKL